MNNGKHFFSCVLFLAGLMFSMKGTGRKKKESTPTSDSSVL